MVLYTKVQLAAFVTYLIGANGYLFKRFKKIPKQWIGLFTYVVPPFFLGVTFHYVHYLFCRRYYNLQSEVNKIKNVDGAIPVIYHNSYNFRAINRLSAILPHPFDFLRSARINNIMEQNIPNFKAIKPFAISSQLLIDLGMSKIYMLKLCSTFCVGKYLEKLVLSVFPECLVRYLILDGMLLATSGTIIAASLALTKGWAINISGGYHHASFNKGGGFCIYPDISLAVRFLQKYHNLKKIMIVDLDAHQGNGYEADFLDDENICIVDFYNHDNYPYDYLAKQAIKVDVAISYYTKDTEYLEKMQLIRQKILEFKPEFLIYNAGSDILRDDPLGRLDITPLGMKYRDRKMFDMCKQFNIPIIMLLSGGYQRGGTQHVGDSIVDIINSR